MEKLAKDAESTSDFNLRGNCNSWACVYFLQKQNPFIFRRDIACFMARDMFFRFLTVRYFASKT